VPWRLFVAVTVAACASPAYAASGIDARIVNTRQTRSGGQRAAGRTAAGRVPVSADVPRRSLRSRSSLWPRPSHRSSSSCRCPSICSQPAPSRCARRAAACQGAGAQVRGHPLLHRHAAV